jgi:cellulose synthase/poly-beta-1,6-N-acetylglucosamine synthase-like glycosyltransferase
MSAPAPRLSVVMPAYDAQRTVAAAIGSALAQTVGEIEVLVVDDGSRDATVAAVQRVAAADARVRLLQQANAGPSAARNRALEVAAAPVVAFLDADDLMLPGYAERMLARLQARPEVDLLGCDAYVFDDRRRRIRRRTVLEETAPPAALAPDPEGQFRQLAANNFVYVGCAVRTAALTALGGFAEETNASEDWDLWLRLLASGRRMELLREPLAIYRLSEGQAHRDRARMERGQERLDAWIDATGRAPQLSRAPGVRARLVDLTRRAVRAAAPAAVTSALACRRRPPAAVAAAFPDLTR